MTDDLIFRSEAINALLKQPNTPTPSVIRRVLRQVPTIDAVEVIRCYQCQSHTEDPETGKMWCWKPLGSMGCVSVKPDDFCSRGERKKEG